ncbi:uncharacterized protein LOC111346462, partial [Stylophora pistillata]|uniref:uncharacterized protein LOC111346462 n=1 Tax=Stylophora pistillata TaxID=50429 RepID=UPI000C041139
LFAAAHDMKMEWLVVKGVREFIHGSGSKNDSWKNFACVMAASVVSNLLGNPFVFEDWPHYGVSFSILLFSQPDETNLFDFVHGHQSWADYLTYMEQDGAWGDHVILCAAANCYKTCIRVVSSLSAAPEVIVQPQCPVDKSRTLVLGHIHEVHYVSLHSTQESSIVKKCQEQLKSYYDTFSKVKTVPWDDSRSVDIEQIYTPLYWVRDERTPSRVRQEKLGDYTNMFKGNKHHRKPTRMLVYGRPGIGKSTFCKKAAYDWSKALKEISMNFCILLLIKLRDVCNLGDICDVLSASKLLASDGPISVDSLYDYIINNQDKVLLILDGYEDYSCVEHSPILEIWKGKLLKDCYVIVTTRHIQCDELRGPSHVQFEMHGFKSLDQIETFASKFLATGKDVEEFMSFLVEKDLLDMAEIPLLLLMLCLLWNEKHCEGLPTSRADIYTHFIQTLLDHRCSSQQRIAFHQKVTSTEVREDLSNIGKVAFDALLQGCLYVRCSELPDSISRTFEKLSEAGLFQIVNMTSLNREKGAFFIHKSVQEFLAAWHIREEVLSIKGDSTRSLSKVETLEKIIKTKEVLKFACELSKEAALAVFRHLWCVGRKESLSERDFIGQIFGDVTPPYVLARGPFAFEVFQRALQSGKAFDKRTKILLIGQDRVGKTSLGKHLRGEKFKEDEPSTDGVEMTPAIKNASLQAWKNPASLDFTSAFDHKCAEVVTKELLSNSPEKSDSVVQSTEESAGGESTKEMRTRESVIKESGTEDTRGDELIHEAKTESIEDGRPEEIPREVSSSGNSRSTTPIQTAKDDIEEPNQEQMPVNVASLVESCLERNVPNNGDSIWPVIWDFAGQAVYHAIHPIFLSQDAIYVLALDLTRELDDLAKCRVRTIDHEEVEVRSPCSKDTNLDHIMKWLDLVHSLQNLEQTSARKPCEPSPPVILVGTHADSVRNLGRDPNQEMNVVYDTICKMAPTEILTHISGCFVIDNTKAGNSDQQEDPQIVSLRQRILEVAENMPHTKMKVPLQWLRVEEKISEMVRNDVHYVTKERFEEDVAEAFCHFDVKDDIEELLHFLHARGTVIYHALPENPKGLVVLDPRWLIKVLTSIITVNPPPNTPAPIRKKYQDLENKGLLSNELLDHALQKWNLEGVREDLLDVMEKFDLICDSRGFQGEDYRYIVPCMLKPLIEDVGSNDVNNGPLPVFLTFSTNYVPSGLFCRLVVLFWEWASQLCKARESPTLYANAARFNVSKLYHLTLEAHQTLIRLRLWTGGECIPEEEKRLCGQLLRHLDDCRTKLQSKYHWLKSVSWDLFLQCTLCKPCPAKCRKETKICVWHKKQGCCHSDCGHYIPLEGYTESCRHSARKAPSFCQEKLNPWIQVSEPPASSELKKGI